MIKQLSSNLEFTTEIFSKEESDILSKYFTNTNKPVFGLINLPDVVKGALFARYSRSNKSLRRLFLDEFYVQETNNEKNDLSTIGIQGKRI